MHRTVTFESSSPVMFKDAAKGSRRKLVARAEYHVPDDGTDGPWPAVIVMEGLGGLKDARELAYGAWLATHGYAALVIDSFGSRGVGRLPHNARAVLVTEAMLCADAFAGLRFLRGRREIDPNRIAVLGFSYGGMISVLTAYEQVRGLFASENEQFAGHAAFYGCSIIRLEQPLATGKPVLMVLGGKDHNVSIERSRLIAHDLRLGGADVSLEVLDGIYHQWDSDDIERRFVGYNLKSCRVTLEESHALREEVSGREVRNRLSRGFLLFRRADSDGYHIQRDEDAIERSNALLLSFLRRDDLSLTTQGRPRQAREAAQLASA